MAARGDAHSEPRSYVGSKGPSVIRHGSQSSNHSHVHRASESPDDMWAKLGRYNLVFTVALAFVGVAIGVGLSRWKPANEDFKDMTLQWLGLPGDIFIRTLKAITLPLVFINVSVAVSDMMNAGRVSRVGWSTVWLYLGTTVLAAGFGFCSILSFSPFITPQEDLEPPSGAEISLGCSVVGSFLTEHADGSVSCEDAATLDEGTNTFIINDLNSTFEKSAKGAPNDISLSDTIYDGIFTKIFTNNIFEAFVNGNFPAVVVFTMSFALAMSRVMSSVEENKFGFILTLLKELDMIFLFLLDSIITFTPAAVLSLIIKAFGSQDDSSDTFARAAYLTIATLLAMAMHFLVVHVGIASLVRRTNPFTFLSYLAPAQTMAFASSSSAATIPVTLKCVLASGVVPRPITNLVVPLGATINMDGSAIYFPCACIWLAGVNGDKLDAAACLLLVIISTLGSVGTAPVPHASLAVILTAYNTVFNKSGTPAGFELLVAIDWLLDRFQTLLNVTGDCVVCSLVGYICPLDECSDPTTAKGVRSGAPDVELANAFAKRPHVHAPVQTVRRS